MMTKQELLKKIQRAVRENAMYLNLSGQKLTELPPELGHLTQLQWLDLSLNQQLFGKSFKLTPEEKLAG